MAIKYIDYLNSQKWKTLRKGKLNSVNGKCEFCGARATEVHHIKYRKKLDDIFLSDLRAVCKKCHLIEELKKEFSKKNLKITPIEEAMKSLIKARK